VQAPVANLLSTCVCARNRVYAFVLDDSGQAIELGSRPVREVLPRRGALARVEDRGAPADRHQALQRGVTGEDQMRFQMEKEIWSASRVIRTSSSCSGRAEGGAGGCGDGFIPPACATLENDF
jgi:hypothetical protein